MNLLLALVKHYGTLENQDKSKVPPFGWTNAKAHFAVELNDDGSIDDILALGGHDKKNRGVVFEVPVRRARTSTPVPYLFCDTAQYILGNVSSTSKPGTYLSMKNAVLAFRGDLGESPALNAAYKFFETWDPEKALQNKFVASAMAFKDAETSTFILFYEGSPIFDDETFRTAYEEIVEKYGEFPIQADRNGNVSITAAPAHMRSMITGEDGLKAKLFRPVSVRGKMTYILSNNKANTNYFGRMQGDAIPVTMQDGHKIVEAAKALIGSKNCYFLPVTSQSLYTKCVIVWSDEVTKSEEDEMLRIWFGNESEAEKTDNIMRLAKARRGRVDILQECDKSKVVNVWQLSVPEKGCSASSFTQTTVGEVLANCIKHYEDMEIDRSEEDRMMGRRSFVEYGLYHMSIQINSMMAQRNGITMDDVNLLIDALQHMFENDMSSGRALTLRKLIVVEHTKPMGNVPRDTVENALTATLKIPDDCPTSYNDYIVTFHRNLLPKEVKVTEYGIDGSSKVML